MNIFVCFFVCLLLQGLFYCYNYDWGLNILRNTDVCYVNLLNCTTFLSDSSFALFQIIVPNQTGEIC